MSEGFDGLITIPRNGMTCMTQYPYMDNEQPDPRQESCDRPECCEEVGVVPGLILGADELVLAGAVLWALPLVRAGARVRGSRGGGRPSARGGRGRRGRGEGGVRVGGVAVVVAVILFAGAASSSSSSPPSSAPAAAAAAALAGAVRVVQVVRVAVGPRRLLGALALRRLLQVEPGVAGGRRLLALVLAALAAAAGHSRRAGALLAEGRAEGGGRGRNADGGGGGGTWRLDGHLRFCEGG